MKMLISKHFHGASRVGIHRFSMLREESAYALKEIAFCIFTVILQLAST